MRKRKMKKINIRNGLNYAKKVLTTEECDLLVLDEALGLVDQKHRDGRGTGGSAEMPRPGPGHCDRQGTAGRHLPHQEKWKKWIADNLTIK